MKLKAVLPLAMGAALALAGCTDPYDPGQRAVGGGLLGAGAGAAIGGIAGGGRGAALGALIGAGAGAVGGAVTTPTPPPPPYYPRGYQEGGYNPPPPDSGGPLNERELAGTGRHLDLADLAAGVYYGNVISDARGAGRSDVTITVTKTAPDRVSVTSDYRRLPPFTIRLTRAMDTIQQVGTSVVFLLDLSKVPYGLGITDDDASWSGSKG
jgi:hypothetical protein